MDLSNTKPIMRPLWRACYKDCRQVLRASRRDLHEPAIRMFITTCKHSESTMKLQTVFEILYIICSPGKLLPCSFSLHDTSLMLCSNTSSSRNSRVKFNLDKSKKYNARKANNNQERRRHAEAVNKRLFLHRRNHPFICRKLVSNPRGIISINHKCRHVKRYLAVVS